jgi:hypothetical protein
LPKTGGSFVEAALQRLLGGGDGLYVDTATPQGRALVGSGTDQHQTVSEIPAPYRDRPILFTVRNPFDHHVSFYEFGWWKTHPGDTFDESAIRDAYPHFPELSFSEYLESFYDFGLLDRGYISSALAESLKAQRIGPLSYEYVRYLFRQPQAIFNDLQLLHSPERLHGLMSDVHFLRQESLNQDLHECLLSMGYSKDALAFILDMDRVYPDDGPRRASEDWYGYYAPDLLELVTQREWLLFSMFPQYRLR